LALRAVACWGTITAAFFALPLALAGCDESGNVPRESPQSEAGQGSAACAGCGGAAGEATGTGGADTFGAVAGAEPVADAGAAGAGAAGAGAAGAAGAAQAEPSLELREISVLQSVELPLMLEQRAVPVAQRNAPLIAGKRALVRAQVELGPGFESRPLLGVLDVKSPERGEAIVSERTLVASSVKDDLDASFVFDVSESDLGPATSYRLRVLEADTSLLAQFPESGYEPLSARALEPFELVLVPMTVNGFAPRLAEGELATLRSRLLALMPASSVELSIAEALSVDYPVDAEGEGWDDALDDLLARRAQAKPAKRVFYYGVMAPAATYSSYCGKSCVLGLSNVAEPDADYERGSIGVAVFEDGSGFKDAWDTLLHELGHALGREHADCGDPDGPDPDYPYRNAGMGGVYGFDFGAMQLIKPKLYRDVMSYCTPVWISDYTYRGLFERLAYIDSEAFRVVSWSPLETFRIARIDRHGFAGWRGEQQARRGQGGLQSFGLLDERGRRVGTVQGRVARRDHLPSKSVWLSARALTESGASAVDLRPLGGGVLPL
jgi:hypothetical protein